MARDLSKSNAHFKRALTRLPLGVASNFRYWGEDRTIYVKYGRGGRVVDLDDNSYVDYWARRGPAILRFARPPAGWAGRRGKGGRGGVAVSYPSGLRVGRWHVR